MKGAKLGENYNIEFAGEEEKPLRCNKLQLYPFFTLIHSDFIALRALYRAGCAVTVGSVLAAPR